MLYQPLPAILAIKTSYSAIPEFQLYCSLISLLSSITNTAHIDENVSVNDVPSFIVFLHRIRNHSLMRYNVLKYKTKSSSWYITRIMCSEKAQINVIGLQ
jgi:hypothetical protein